MAFDTGKEDDLFACRAVRSLMQFPDGAEIVAHHDGTEIPAAFARCEKIIAARFHAAVLALRMGIPFFPLIFREKMRNLLSDMQYPIPVCDLDDIDEVSLRIFLRTEKKSYHLEKDTFERACQHPQRLKQRLAQWQDL